MRADLKWYVVIKWQRLNTLPVYVEGDAFAEEWLSVSVGRKILFSTKIFLGEPHVSGF